VYKSVVIFNIVYIITQSNILEYHLYFSGIDVLDTCGHSFPPVFYD